MHTHIKTEIIFVNVHMYNTAEIISPPFLKIHVAMWISWLTSQHSYIASIAKKGYRDLDKLLHFQHWNFKYINYIGSLNANFCSKYASSYIEYTQKYSLHWLNIQLVESSATYFMKLQRMILLSGVYLTFKLSKYSKLHIPAFYLTMYLVFG